uniref:Mucin-like protein n=1 Tax=Crassostrea virginica TaxID=6565 RepID=A0A8B8E2M2_CRAVI|nr:mucin-like protein [Crassostrea virginica]
MQGSAGDDLLSAKIENPVGLTCGKSLFHSIYIYTNGYVTFDSEYNSGRPQKFTGQSAGQPDAMVAPLWSDMDMTGGSNIWYHFYNRFSANSSVLLEAQSLIFDNYKDPVLASSFSPNTALVVTWENVKPAPASIYSSQNASVQLILVSDGVTTFTAFLFKQMDWRPPKPSLLGYRCGANSYHHPASLTNGMLQEVYNGGYNKEDKHGLWIFKLDTMNDFINYAERCYNWMHETGKAEVIQVTIANAQLTNCPCSEDRILKDGRFFPYLDQPNCYVSEFPPSGISGTRKCCYSRNSTVSTLITSGKQAGFIYLAHPLHNPRQANLIDNQPHSYCCVQSNLCNEFLRIRYSDTCDIYQPLTSGSSFGDPHITTLDGLTYTFNGLGEYVMLTMIEPTSNTTLLDIQTRTAQAINANGTLINATVFQAFAVQEKNGGQAMVEINLAKTGLLVYADKVDVTTQFYASDTYSYYVANSIFLKKTKTHAVQILFPSGITFDMALNFGMLELTTGIPETLSASTTNLGLLGNINGDIKDDFYTPNGTLLPFNATEKELYFNFGELWRIDCSKSLFVYQNDMSCSSYQQTGFTPIFMDDFTEQEIQQAQDTCGGPQNVNCIYDFLATQNQAIANATKTAYDSAVLEKKLAANIKPFLDGVGSLYTVVGESFNITAYAYDVDEENVRIVMLSPVNVTSQTKLANVSFFYTYTPQDMTPYTVELYAVDELNGISVMLSENVYQCYGCSNHGSCNYSIATATSISTFFIAPCSCDIGWTGNACEIDIDGCAGSPCDPLSNCTDNSAARHQVTGRPFECQNCPTGYQMSQSYKCIDLDECANSSLNGCNQLCTNTDGSYSCSCYPGYRLTNTLCTDINECSEGTNICQQLCINADGYYNCSCVEGYSLQADGSSCTLQAPQQSCGEMNCSQGCSVNATGTAFCFCNQGYTLMPDGQNCTDVDECQTPGQCSQLCSNTDGGFSCSCFIGYKLQEDQISCSGCDSMHWGYNCNQSCGCSQNALQCDSARGCVCRAGWSGSLCDVNVNECADPSLCSATEVCVDSQGSYSCQCIDGYQRNATGVCQNVDECLASLDNCSSTETCQDIPGSFLCPCKAGYQRNSTSGNCIDLDECQEGIHSCPQSCQNTLGSYFCTCYIGFQLQDDRVTCVKSRNPCLGSDVDGTCDTAHGGCTVNASNVAYCFCDSGYQLQLNSSGFSLCPNINECETNTSGCSHFCQDVPGSFLCSCPEGNKLTADQKTCESCAVTNSWGPNCTTPCNCGVGSSSCNPVSGCVCAQGWTGTLCEDNINECVTSPPCNATQLCVDNPGSYTCTCRTGFQADQNGGCQDVDECSINQDTCKQLCTNTEGSYNCSCSPGFLLMDDGNSCQDIDECATGKHNCSQACSNSEGSYLCYCNQGYELDSDKSSCNLITTTTTTTTTTTAPTSTTISTTTSTSLEVGASPKTAAAPTSTTTVEASTASTTEAATTTTTPEISSSSTTTSTTSTTAAQLRQQL